jgi:hypothetical protein
MAVMINAYEMLVRRARRTRLVERPRHKWKDDTEHALKNRIKDCGLDSFA